MPIHFDHPSIRSTLLQSLGSLSVDLETEQVRSLLNSATCLDEPQQQRILEFFHRHLGISEAETLFRKAQLFGTESPSIDSSKQLREERERRYQEFISQSSQKVLDHLETHDRGLVSSPMGLRDILERVLGHLIRGNLSDQLKTLAQKKVLLIVQGK